MKSFRDRLLSTTVIPAVFGAGIAIVGGTFVVCGARAGRPATENPAALPKAQPKSEIIELAACNPCAAKKACNPCNPCAAKKACSPCNPCAAKGACGACNPCAAKKACGACNPCAAKNPCGACNPCAAKKACGACNPCAAKNPCNPCNPCAAKNPCGACGACNPCNPCNPCGAASAAVSQKCVVPRLTAAWAKSPCNPCNPCAAKNPCAAENPCGACNPCAAKKACGACNPCAAKKACGACNPCAAKNPCGACNPCAAKKACGACNPCAAKKACSPCNPCAAKNPCGPCNPCNPCNPCGASAGAEITPAEAVAVYDCLKPEMTAAYAKAGVAQVAGFTGWVNVATSPYQSGTHGGRYVNNYADPHGDYRYKMYEKAGTFPLGTVLAKDSFVVRPDGKVAVGPLFVMEKMGDDFSKATGNWRYSMIMPNGQVAGRTGAKGMSMQFCADCHSSVAPDQDHVMFLPEEFRKNY